MATLPSLSVTGEIFFRIFVGEWVLPELDVQGELFYRVFVGEWVLPELDVQGSITYTGPPSISASLEMPQITAVGTVYADPAITASVNMPAISITGEVYSGKFLTGAMVMPQLEIDGTILLPLSIQASLTLPQILVPGTLAAPVNISSALVMPGLTAVGTINRVLLGDLWAARPRNNIYTCTLTADGFDDVTIPISSWQARFRTDDAQSYVAVVIPGIAYWDYVVDRAGGTLTIAKGWKFLDTGEEFVTDIIVADIDSISSDEGPRSASIGITGYTTLTEAAKSVTIDKVFYKAVAQDGTTRWRTELYLDIDSDGDFFIKPGDTVTYGSDSIEVEYITITVNNNQETMEIKAAA